MQRYGKRLLEMLSQCSGLGSAANLDDLAREGLEEQVVHVSSWLQAVGRRAANSVCFTPSTGLSGSGVARHAILPPMRPMSASCRFRPLYLRLCCKTPTGSFLECRDRMKFENVTNAGSTFRPQIV